MVRERYCPAVDPLYLLQGLVSPQNVESSACTKRSVKQRMVQNASGLVHKSLPTTCPKITHGLLILAPMPFNGGVSDAVRARCMRGARAVRVLGLFCRPFQLV